MCSIYLRVDRLAHGNAGTLQGVLLHTEVRALADREDMLEDLLPVQKTASHRRLELELVLRSFNRDSMIFKTVYIQMETKLATPIQRLTGHVERRAENRHKRQHIRVKHAAIILNH